MKKILLYSAITLSIFAFNTDSNLSIKAIKSSRYNNLIQIDKKINTVDTVYTSLKDQDGVVLFEEKTITDNYSRKFSLDVEESALNDTLSFEIRTNKQTLVNQKFVPREILGK